MYLTIGILILLIILIVLLHAQWLLWIGDFLIVENTLHPADVIHVIAGEDYRTEYAIRLYKQGLGKTLFFTGGWCEIHHYNHGEHAQKISLEQSVPLDAIAFDDSKVTSTYMEAEKLKEWIQHNPYPVRSVIIVSDPFHMRRARWAYRKVLGNHIQIQMAPVPFSLTPFQLTWWNDRESRIYVREEYSKLIYYLLRYQYSWGIFKDWLVTLDTE